MVNEKLPNYVVPDLTDFKVLIFINLKVHLYIFGCCVFKGLQVPFGGLILLLLNKSQHLCCFAASFSNASN